ncbi:insulin-like peptide receptor [Calliphora vicina]|uniref:insulin-like peptide receptor n=1 Tax=Calliphora vicina TaxID=7373 RepID=UPI00325A4B62
MKYSTAVALKEKDNDHNNNSPETGVFVTHSPTKTSSKNNSSNMLLSHNYTTTTTTTLLTMCLVSLHFTQQCLATFAAPSAAATATSANNFDVFKSPPAPYECGSLDLRNNCDDFIKLSNCTAITGFLDIAQLPRASATCDFREYRFENLREITDFLIINDVRNLSSFKNMFPNLSVIRGQQLFVNYALVMTSVHDLEKIEFKSLIAIQRGHVLIDANPKLCYTEKINWTRLTLRPGKNTIFLDNKAKCPLEAKCNGCKRDSCWSNDVCQKLENDSVISPMQDTSECHELCLGGCYNRTAQGCVVCKGYTDHGTCVRECPLDKYASRHYLRCYTREECVNKKKQLIFRNTCVDSCPSGYKLNNATRECDSCGGINNCLKVCHDADSSGVLYIANLMDTDNIRGCQILNATVMVNINEFFDQQELADNLRDVQEIIGHLKINRSPYLTSLDFFQNLKKIHGEVLENNNYALIIYNNNKLSELWNVKSGFEILKGGMYIHANDKLCNRRIRQFRERVIHDNSLDSFQTSDQEVLCSPAKLNLYVEVLNHRSIKFYWSKNQTLAEVEIIYKPLANKEQVVNEKSELDTDVCNRINWRRELKFQHELQENSTHYIYIVQNLEPHTRYAGLVKTFNGEDDTQEARSEIKYAITQFDIPTAPKISLKAKTYDTLQIEFSHDDVTQVIDFYMLEVYGIPDDKEMLDRRDYCDEPVLNYKDNGQEDYEDCCSRREEERKDHMFLSQLRQEFACSLDRPLYCQNNTEKFNKTKEHKPVLTKRFEAWESNYTIRSLERFHLYVIQVQACNHAGCSSYNLLTTRTNYSIAADKVYDFTACKLPHSNDYRIHFSEPQLPNGYITSYALHLRYHIPTSSRTNSTLDHNDLVCITRLEHERNNYLYVSHSNFTFNEAAVRVNSLGHRTFIGWFNITTCPTTKLAGGSSHGWNIFLVFFLIGAGGTVLWVCYKRRYWRKIPQLRRYLPLHMGWSYLRPESHTPEDRQILVDGFETVRFHNSPDEDKKYLVHLGKRN